MGQLSASFDDERSLLAATTSARRAGIAIDDAYTPYAVHGLDEAMGVRRSRLTWVCFAAGLTGAASAIGFQIWTSAVSWRLNVGGKPFASIPAFIPVTFELTVLSAALTTAFFFFFRSRLYPGRTAAPPPRVTDDRFVLVVADSEAARRLLTSCGALELSPAAGSSS
jgi:hypothetical protein